MKIRTRNEFPILCKSKGLFGTDAVEFGVARGDFSAVLLESNVFKAVWSIDRWTDHHDESEFRFAKERLSHYKGSKIIRNSFDAVHLSPATFGFAYVDGYAHTGQESGATIRQAYTALQPNGILAGHDYCDQFEKTRNSVDQFCREFGYIPQIIGEGVDRFPSWWIQIVQ